MISEPDSSKDIPRLVGFLSAGLLLAYAPGSSLTIAMSSGPVGGSRASLTNYRSQTDSAHSGSIRGVIIAEGQPLPRVLILVKPVDQPAIEGIQVKTGEDGQFLVSGLATGKYTVSAVSAVYIRHDEVHSPGDFVTMNLTRGCVITGRVTDDSGIPLVYASVTAIPLGAAVPGTSLIATSRSGETDDCGIYRIYGLVPGAYLVTTSPWFEQDIAGECQIYYPSSTASKAEKVVVTLGEEAAGIDIKYRSITGHTVSGQVTGSKGYTPEAIPGSKVVVRLADSGTGLVVTGGSANHENGRMTFSLDAVPDGDYVLDADYLRSQERTASGSRRVSVRGANVAGANVSLAPMARTRKK